MSFTWNYTIIDEITKIQNEVINELKTNLDTAKELYESKAGACSNLTYNWSWSSLNDDEYTYGNKEKEVLNNLQNLVNKASACTTEYATYDSTVLESKYTTNHGTKYYTYHKNYYPGYHNNLHGTHLTSKYTSNNGTKYYTRCSTDEGTYRGANYYLRRFNN